MQGPTEVEGRRKESVRSEGRKEGGKKWRRRAWYRKKFNRAGVWYEIGSNYFTVSAGLSALIVHYVWCACPDIRVACRSHKV